MSEYQYYEFQAADKPLNEQDMRELRKLSTRAQISPTSFINVYNWGDFRGDPLTLVEKYFDSFLYLANWGTHWLMLRIPNRLLDTETACRYCLGKSAKLHVKGKNLILEFHPEDEDRNWVDGEDLLSSNAMNKECKPRTVTELLVAGKIRAEERKRLVADQKTKEKARRDREKAIAREKYLADLATRESEVWEEVDTLIETKRQSDYDESVKLLVDLRDVGREKGGVDRFEERLQDLCRQHIRKSSFIRRIKKAGLGDGKA